MDDERRVRLADYTTLRLGGVAEQLVEVDDTAALVEAVTELGRDGALILGGGSNLVVADSGVDVPVVKVATRGVTVESSDSAVEVTIAAGESWDELVARAVVEGWSGIEALSGIPGLVGATPIQNVGAYGQEIADVVTGVAVYDRLSARVHTMTTTDCAFGYRTSVFKSEPDRFVVLSVGLRLSIDPQSRPIGYAELAKALAVDVGQCAPLGDVRDAVLELRRAKGMVIDDADHDTWSAGSFFTNPIVSASVELPHGAPRWTQSDGRIKTSAAWLIERAGFSKGYGRDVGSGSVTLSNKHTLALTNRGNATTSELLKVARIVRDGVREQFNIELHPEPTLVGCRL